MFKKILIANRGEIAVRIIRTCREMGILTVAVYDPSDRGSLHVRLSDECVALPQPKSFMDGAAILQIAVDRGVDAVHPGYGYLAEDAEFIAACTGAGIVFVGPPADVVAALGNKIGALETARAAGVPTVAHSPRSFSEEEYPNLAAAAQDIGFPIVLKSCRGGRGRGERVVSRPEQLVEATRRAQVETQAVYGNKQLYVERAILPAHQVGVQILADHHGNLIHLGDREGSVIHSNQKIVEEGPSVCLSDERRAELFATAGRLARLFNYRGLGTVEFIADQTGQFYFSEIKARLQVDHTITEALTRIDLVREQLRIAAGEPLAYRQEDVHIQGHAIMCRVQAQDPFRRFLPSPGHVRQARLPGGVEVRVDTYIAAGVDVPPHYDPLIAKITVWDATRSRCISRMRRALEDFNLVGTHTNIPLLLRVLTAPAFIEGRYASDLLNRLPADPSPEHERVRRDLAVAAALLYARRREAFNLQPEPWTSGWHRASRELG